MTPQITTVMALLYLITGGITLVVMMAKVGGRKFATPELAARIHRLEPASRKKRKVTTSGRH